MGSRLYALGGGWWSGGSYTAISTRVDYMQVADLAPDGSLGAWRQTTPLPAAGSWTAVARGSQLYALRPHALGMEAFTATVDGDGDVGAWTRLTEQPGQPVVSGAAAAVLGEHLYLAGGFSAGPTTAVTVGRFGADGQISGWETAPGDSFVGPRGAASLASDGAHLFLLGGFSNDPAIQTPREVQTTTPDPATGHLAPFTAPPVSAPLRVRATAGDGAATVSWEAPAASAEVTGYVVSNGDAAHDVRAPAGATSAAVTGLANGEAQSFRVAATYAGGVGPSSGPSNEVTPFASVRWRPLPALHDAVRSPAVVGGQLFVSGDAEGWGAAVLAPDGGVRFYTGPGWQGGSTQHQWAQTWRSTGDGAACAYRVSGTYGSSVEVHCFAADDFLGVNLGSRFRDDFPATRLAAAAAIAGQFIYVLGGDDFEGGARTAFADVFVAPILPDGTTGGWTRTAPLPRPLDHLSAAAHGADIYTVVDGVLLRASASSDGTLSSWEQAAPALPAAGLARLAVDGDLLYLLGQDGRFAVGRIGGDGTVARWEVDPAEAVPPPDLADPQGTPAFAELALGAGHVYVERRGTAAAFVVGTLDPATGHLRALR